MENHFNLDKETLFKILDNSYDEIFVLDAEDKVIYVNRASERHYGMKASEVMGKSLAELFALEYWTPPITPIVHREKRRVTMEQTTFLGRRLITTVTPVFDEHGEIELTVHNARDLTQLDGLKRELEMTRRQLAEAANGGAANIDACGAEIVAHNRQMKLLIEYVNHVAKVDATVLILGESGTGKGVIARQLHRASRRSTGPFLAINCAAIPEDLLESELFGYTPGAFTGAERSGKKGLIELADKGTLFLDEIGELSPRLQAKLLQFIQDKQFIPIGGVKVKQADVRLVAATNQNLSEMVELGKFRGDLYYRLNVIEIKLPPLRKRPEDVIPLVYFYLNQVSKKYNITKDISEECLAVLTNYEWPGNVRELENLIERLVVSVRENEIQPHHLPESFAMARAEMIPAGGTLDSKLEEVEGRIIRQALAEHGTSRKVAQALKISQTKAVRLINKYCK